MGCERCHGPGSEHVMRPSAQTIVNPAKLDSVRANDTCIQCHSQGQPLPDVPRSELAEWPARRDTGGPYPSRAWQPGVAVRVVPHAEDRTDDGRRERPQSYIRVPSAIADGSIQDAELVYERLPQRQVDGLGAGDPADMEQRVAVEGGVARARRLWITWRQGCRPKDVHYVTRSPLIAP